MALFHDFQAIVDAADKILGREGSDQGTFCRASEDIAICPFTMDYIQKQEGIWRRKSKRSCYRSRTEAGMTKRAYGSKEDWFILRFETLGQLNMLLSLFGPTILMGIRSHRVRIGGSRPILRGDRIIVVMADPSPVGSSFTIRTNNRGVDMISNGRKLRLVIRYERTQEGDTAYMNSPHMILCCRHQLISRERPASTSRCRKQYYTRSSVKIVYTATLLP
jgi:hypothetical protein